MGVFESTLIAALYAGVGEVAWVSAGHHFQHIAEAVDICIVVAEIALLVYTCLRLRTVGLFFRLTQLGYDTLLTLCQSRGLSLAEIATVTTLFLGFFILDFFVVTGDDDLLEVVSYGFALVIGLAFLLLVVAVDVHYYFMVSSVSGGSGTLRVLYTDLINNMLYIVRIFFCWIRYLFYDLQGELVDFIFHYTELTTGRDLVVESGAAAEGLGL